MNEAQRALAAARFANLRRRQAPSCDRAKPRDIEARTRGEAAETFAISVCSVDRAKKILKCANPDVVAAIGAGQMSLAEAEARRPRRPGSGEAPEAAQRKDQKAGRAARRLIEAMGAEAALTVLGIVQSVGCGRVRVAVRAIATASPDAARFAAPTVDPVMAARVAKSAATRAERKRTAALAPARPYPVAPVPIAPLPLAMAETATAA